MTVANADIARWRANLQGEVDGASVYRAMARAESDRSLAAVYEQLATVEDRHAEVWSARLRDAGAMLGVRPSWRARVLAVAAGRAGAAFVAPTLAGRESHDQRAYDEQPEAGDALRRDERSHARVLREIA